MHRATKITNVFTIVFIKYCTSIGQKRNEIHAFTHQLLITDSIFVTRFHLSKKLDRRPHARDAMGYCYLIMTYNR